MPAPKISNNGGILVESGGMSLAMDPRGPVRSDYAFVSHAHVDHMHNPSKSEKVISSAVTAELARARGYELGATTEEVEGIELLDSGHILGSRAVRVGEEVFYTGDASGRERGFLGRCRTRKAKVLIMETTFGSPEYVFPPIAKLVKEVNSVIGEMYHRGKSVVLMGYPLGKAQLLSYFFSSWEPLLFHESVLPMNEIYSKNGVRLKDGEAYRPSKREGLPAGPWVMIAPMSSGRSAMMSHLKKKHGAVLVAFSGWAAQGGFRLSMGADFAFPLSDHCDYPELVKLVEGVSPELVYTTHGFAAEFATDLRRMGFSARPLAPYQSALTDYTSAD